MLLLLFGIVLIIAGICIAKDSKKDISTNYKKRKRVVKRKK